MKPKAPAWLRDAVFYEIYPQSFHDSNGDGVGDLQGVIQKLDHVKWLGCDAIWLNPCFMSPFLDAGYDVSDYYQVAPRYGSNADLKELFVKAAELGIKVILDLVPGHTSIQHPWFQQSSQPTPNAYSNWYIWTDGWLDSGGEGIRAINGFCDRDANYVINFFYSQPALNFGFAKPDPKRPWQLPVDHPDVQAVRAEIRNIIKFWLDMGAAGFRVDMAGSLVKNDPGKKETSKFWRGLRSWLDQEYPEAALVSEWSFAPQALNAGFHVDFMIHCETTAYTSLLRNDKGRNVVPNKPGTHSFFDADGKGDIREFVDTYLEHRQATRSKGYISLPSGNHDLPRISFKRTQREQELIFAFLLTMPGVPFIYYGDEIGMEYLAHLTSKEGGYNRTGSRTPMQWDDSPNAGFSSAPANKLYLPVDPNPDRPTVEAMRRDPSSLLHRVKALVELRHGSKALGADGDFEVLHAKKNQYPLVYLRTRGAERHVVVVNPSAEPAKLSLKLASPPLSLEYVMTLDCDAELKKDKLKIEAEGVSYGIFKLS